MKKFLSALLILSVATAALFAGSKTYTAYTEHFDIIYTDKSVKAADSLYKSCEEIYDQVSELLGYEGSKHFPVYIDSDNQILNAYETQMPYNRIYLRDTTDQIGNITNQEDVFLGVFKHELTHALQFEIKPGWFIKAGSAVFGDWFSFQGLELTPSYVEGTAVMVESSDGINGRLNNNLAMQRLKQAKLENKFPSFFKAIGMRDTYPSGEIYYLFGGAFTQYLKDTYGIEKLQNFFDSTGRIKLNNFTAFKFRKAFGKKQNLAWNDFKNSIEVPYSPIEASPISGKSRYTNLRYSNGNLYVINTAKGTICKINENNKVTRFASVLSTESALSFAEDGSYLVLNNSEEKTAVKLYSASKALKHTFTGYRGGTIVVDNGQKYYALYRDESQNTYVDIFDSSYKTVSTFYLGWGVYASDFCSPMKQVVACIVNINGKQNILLINIATQKVALVDNPDNIAITSLNYSPNQNYLESDIENDIERGILTFSWTTEGQSDALVRYGQLNIIRSHVYLSITQRLSQKDVNGSIKYPVLENAKVVYIGSFYDHDRICSINQIDLELSQPKDIKFKSYKPKSYEDLYGDVEIPMRKYQPLKYFFDGSLLPIATETLSDVLKSNDFYAEFFENNSIPVGLTYYTMDPSTNFDFIGSLGYFIQEKIPYLFAQSTLSGKKTSLTGQVQYELIKPNYSITSGFLSFNFKTTLKHTNEVLSVTNTLGATNVGVISNYKQLKLTAYDNANITYQNARYTGTGKFDYRGFVVSVDAGKNLFFSRDSFTDKIIIDDTTDPIVTNAEIQVHLPGFGAVLSHFSFSAMGKVSNITPVSVTANANVVPLCIEIQNGFNFLGLYFNRFVVDASYSGTYEFGDEIKFNLQDIEHNVSAKAYFTVSEAIGMIAKESVSLGVEAYWTIGEPLMDNLRIKIYNSLGLNLPSIKGSSKANGLAIER